MEFYQKRCTRIALTRWVFLYKGYSTTCTYELYTDRSCLHQCTNGYIDNNNGNGQMYTCPDGKFSGTVLTCERNNIKKYIYWIYRCISVHTHIDLFGEFLSIVVKKYMLNFDIFVVN